MKKIIVAIVIILICSCKEQKSESSIEKEKLKVEKNKKDSIVELQRKNTELLKKINISNISLKFRENGIRAASVYGSGVTMYFTIQNNTDFGIKMIFFNGTFKFSGRTYEHTENINFEFRKGLEPGETQEVAMRPGLLSEWDNKIKPIDKGEFKLETLGIEDYDENKLIK